MASENMYVVRCKLDPEIALLSDKKYVIRKGSTVTIISNLEFEFDVWSSCRDNALIKGMKKVKGTQGLISVSVSEVRNRRIKR
jgi:hypothetical protein